MDGTAFPSAGPSRAYGWTADDEVDADEKSEGDEEGDSDEDGVGVGVGDSVGEGEGVGDCDGEGVGLGEPGMDGDESDAEEEGDETDAEEEGDRTRGGELDEDVGVRCQGHEDVAEDGDQATDAGTTPDANGVVGDDSGTALDEPGCCRPAVPEARRPPTWVSS